MIEAVSKLETIEEERVRGVHTTHMRGVLSIGAVQGPFDFWVDADGVTRLTRQSDAEGSFVTVREYVDFGVDVQVQRPTVGKE